MTTVAALPHWDMTTVFPSLESKPFEEAFSAYLSEVDKAVALFQRLGIERLDTGRIDDETVRSVEEALTTLTRLSDEGMTLRAYIMSFVATDSRNTVAQARASELSMRSVVLSQLGLDSLLGSAPWISTS